MAPRVLTSIRDLSARDVAEVFELSADVKAAPDKYRRTLAGKCIGVLSQTPSTRTVVSFLVGVEQLGGVALPLGESELDLARGESIADTGRSLSFYLDGLVARMRSHADFVELSRASSVPVINGLTDLLHPCHALADYFTLGERYGELSGKKIAFLGSGDHMCHSLIYGAIKAGMNIAVATPPGHEPKAIILKSANREAGSAGVSVSVTNEPEEAVAGAHAVYAGGWFLASEPAEREARSVSFAGFEVNAALMSAASPDAVFMHAMPASRGREAAEDVIEGESSLVFEQVRNRLHVHKAILCALLSSA